MATFVIKTKQCSSPGQVLIQVIKDSKLDKSNNAYVQLQVPQDFAEYLLMIQAEFADISAPLQDAIEKCKDINP